VNPRSKSALFRPRKVRSEANNWPSDLLLRPHMFTGHYLRHSFSLTVIFPLFCLRWLFQRSYGIYEGFRQDRTPVRFAVRHSRDAISLIIFRLSRQKPTSIGWGYPVGQQHSNGIAVRIVNCLFLERCRNQTSSP